MPTSTYSSNVIGYRDTKAIMAFLTYLQKHYSKQVNPKDIFLIAAVAAWWYQEGRSSIGNNPFNIRPGMVSFMASGVRSTKDRGKFLIFSTLAKGFEAAAYLLMHARKSYGYGLAIAALKNGGNQAAVDFLAAMAMSSWSGSHYGVHNWTDAYDPRRNHLLRNYGNITGVTLVNPNPPKPKKPKRVPELPRDFNYQVVVRNYLDPWLVKSMYLGRRRRQPNLARVDGADLTR